MFSRLIAVFLIAQTCCAQTLHFGVRGAARVPEELSQSAFPAYSTRSGQPLIGPTFEIMDRRERFGVELSALWKRSHFSTQRSSGTPISGFTQDTRDGTFRTLEFPVLLKVYHQTVKPVRLFGGTGLSMRHVDGSTHSYGSQSPGILNPSGSTTNFDRNEGLSEILHPNSPGLVFAVGIETRGNHVRFTPEVRLMHWFSDAVRSSSGSLYSTRNGVEFGLGCSFVTRR